MAISFSDRLSFAERFSTSEVQLKDAEGARLLRVQIFPISDAPVHHPKAGELKFDRAFAEALVRNFTAYPGKLPLDYDHGTENARGDGGAIAAGWIRSVKIEGEEVVAYADPTPKATSAVEAREYLLASATVNFNWVDPRDGKGKGPTLLSVALTNRPFLRGMSEVTPVDAAGVTLRDGVPSNSIKENAMDTILLTEHQAAVSAIQLQLTEAQAATTAIQVQLSEAQAKTTAAEAKVQALEAEAAKVVALSDVDALVAAGKALPAERDALVELRQANPELFQKLTAGRAVVVKLTEKGAGGNPEATTADKGKILVQKANELVATAKTAGGSLSFSDAIREAGRLHPDLVESI